MSKWYTDLKSDYNIVVVEAGKNLLGSFGESLSSHVEKTLETKRNVTIRTNETVKETGTLEVPMHIRNAPTSMMSEMGYGKDYQYAHDHDEAFVPGESYLPEAIHGPQFYHPVDRGLETRIAEKLAYLRRQNEHSEFQRYPATDESAEGNR